MRFALKEKLLSTICISFTFIILTINLFEIVSSKVITDAQLNLFCAFLWTSIAVIILSLHRWLERFSPLVMIVIQYVTALIFVLLSVWILGHLISISPHGYRDVTLSFSSIYTIGAFIYYIDLNLSIRKQNKTLEYIRQDKQNNS